LGSMREKKRSQSCGKLTCAREWWVGGWVEWCRWWRGARGRRARGPHARSSWRLAAPPQLRAGGGPGRWVRGRGAHLGLVKRQLHRLRVARAPAADVLVGGVGLVAGRVPHARLLDALLPLERELNAPEAPARKGGELVRGHLVGRRPGRRLAHRRGLGAHGSVLRRASGEWRIGWRIGWRAGGEWRIGWRIGWRLATGWRIGWRAGGEWRTSGLSGCEGMPCCRGVPLCCSASGSCSTGIGKYRAMAAWLSKLDCKAGDGAARRSRQNSAQAIGQHTASARRDRDI
jgi:hypothetical protein